MEARIENPTMTFPGALEALTKLRASIGDAGIPETTYYLIEVRASQINGCGVCLDMHTRELKHAGEPNERIFTVAAWREAPYFTDAERAALALTEAATRLADRPDSVPDEVWEEAARHYTEPQLAALVISIATINAWNRFQAVTGQISGDWVEQVIQTSTRRRERPAHAIPKERSPIR
jgi:AhpD family alkylhydroperoxidase